jgi:hypothetical protein
VAVSAIAVIVGGVTYKSYQHDAARDSQLGALHHNLANLETASGKLETFSQGVEDHPDTAPSAFMPDVHALTTAARGADGNLRRLNALGYDTGALTQEFAGSIVKVQPVLTEIIENVRDSSSAGMEAAIDGIALIQRGYENVTVQTSETHTHQHPMSSPLAP